MLQLSFFLIIAGFSLGLGAVTVIDFHGFLARRSSYWTQATIRTHKVTKPLIWVGMMLLLLGTCFAYRENFLSEHIFGQLLIIQGILILNGAFLSFVISPLLLRQEKLGRDREILPISLQQKIGISFIISVLGWWSLVYIFSSILSTR